MATYEQLTHSSFTDVVVPFVTDNGLGVTDTGVSVLTGYTLPNTPFTFKSEPETLENTYIGPSLDKIIWDMGDGTFLTGPTVTKVYEYPGDYEVFCVFTDQNGVTHKNTRSQKIRVINYMPDALIWYTPTIVGERGGDPQRVVAGVPSDPLTVYRMNSWQTWPAVSADGGYWINLYASGSKSQPLTTKDYWSNADAHFVPTWRFVKTYDSTVPIERVQTDENDFVYVKVVDNELVHTTNIDIDATFAGTSGRSTFHYIDDSATKLTSNRDTATTDDSAFATFENESDLTGSVTEIQTEVKDPILYASFDTSKFSLRKDDEILATSKLFDKSYFEVYMTAKIGLPIQVRFNQPTKLEVTSNGIRGFEIDTNKFIGSPIAMAVRATNKQDFPVNSSLFPEFKSRWSAETQHFSGGDITTDTLTAQGFITAFLSAANTKLKQIVTPFYTDEDFKRWDIGALYPENEASKIVRVIVAERRTKQPYYPDHDRNNAVTIPFNELVEENQQLLLANDIEAFGTQSQLPRLWRTKNNKDYYGYISPDSTYKDPTAIDFEFVDYDNGFATPGAFVGMVNLKETADLKIDPGAPYRIYVETLVDPPKTFTYDVPYYYVTNPVNDTIWQLKPSYYRTYSYGDAGTTQTYTAPISTISPGNSGMYGMAVDPTGGHMIAVDGDTDKIIRYWRDMELRTETFIGDILPDELTRDKYPRNLDEYGFTPSSVCFDSNMDYWVSLYDSVSAVKFSGETDEILAYAAPSVANILADARTTNPDDMWSQDATHQIVERDGRPGEYAEPMITPGMVETCRDNSIIVTYTNPVCSFMVKYDSMGNEMYKYEMLTEDGARDHSRYFTGDMCIDVSDHVWAVTESTGLRPDGQPDFGIPKSAIYTLDEQLNLRYSVSSLEGTKFYDILQPPPPEIQYISVYVEMQQRFNFDTQEDEEVGLLIGGYGSWINPTITLYEGNVYTFVNKYYMDGKHKLELREIPPDQLYESSPNYVPPTSPYRNFDITGNKLYAGVQGYNRTDGQFAIHITEDTPRRFLLIDPDFPELLKLQVLVKFKPKAVTRPANTFEVINNATYITPDTDNNIWFSWGNRFISRWNPLKFKVDTTVAVGSAAHDPRYHPLSAETYERRDNTDRESAILGIATDTADNIIVINNFDKRVYTISSESPTVSGFIEIPTTDYEPSVFDWDTSITSDRQATRDDFMLFPDTYMTKEQVEVFLKGEKLNVDDPTSGLNRAYLEYIATMGMQNGDVKFRTSHALQQPGLAGYHTEITGYGDWTGFRWINKYDNNYIPGDATTGFARLSGVSEEFFVWDKTNTPEVVKVNENENIAEIMRSYMTHPALSKSPKLYNDLMNNVFGGTAAPITTLGKRIYERITNYVMNHVDVDTCTIRSLVGLAQMVGYKSSMMGYPLPAEMTRLMDLLSINVGKLRGNVLLDVDNFERYGNWHQTEVGHNLGAEIVFVYDWRSQNYYTGDYVFYGGEYYQAKDSIQPDETPTQSDKWLMWPSGHVRTQHKSVIDRIYSGKDQLWRDNHYQNLPVIVKLVQNLNVKYGEKYVLQNIHDDEYTLVDIMMISYKDGKSYKIELDYTDFSGYKISNPNKQRPLKGERMSLFDDTLPMYVVEEDVLTLIGPTENSTISLLRNRTYQFDVDSVGHPVIITEHPGSEAEPTKYVADQNVEFGTIVIQTNDDPVFGPMPDKLYYQSLETPRLGGSIELVTPENIAGYSTQYDGLTSYNINVSLSSSDDYNRMGWGVAALGNSNVWSFYNLYEYVETEQTQNKYKHVGNVIDWDSSKTSVKYSTSGMDQWYGRGGIADLMFEKQVRTGLDLFNGLEDLDK